MAQARVTGAEGAVTRRDRVESNLRSELYVERGGPAYRLMQRIGIILGEGPSVGRRIVAFWAITWIPLLFLSLLEGYALGPTPRESFLLDFATYARFFIALPLLFVADAVVGPRLTSAGLHFVQGGFIRPEDYPAFDGAIARLVRWRESVWVETILLSMALTAAWTLTADTFYGTDASTWVSSESGSRFSLAGLWYKFIALPVLRFFWLRWVWQLIIWTRFLGAVSRLNLDLVPTHADAAGGLGFLGTAHVPLALIPIAISCILSADAGFRFVFDGTPWQTFQTFEIPLSVVQVATQVICVGPLLVFAPIMVRKRWEALREFGALVGRYDRAFYEKWLTGQAPDAQQLLGSADISSLADLGGSFQCIRDMKVVPFSFRVVMEVAVVAALPAVPLLPLVIPWRDILEWLAGAVI